MPMREELLEMLRCLELVRQTAEFVTAERIPGSAEAEAGATKA
jgi:hypothetical protein